MFSLLICCLCCRGTLLYASIAFFFLFFFFLHPCRDILSYQVCSHTWLCFDTFSHRLLNPLQPLIMPLSLTCVLFFLVVAVVVVAAAADTCRKELLKRGNDSASPRVSPVLLPQTEGAD